VRNLQGAHEDGGAAAIHPGLKKPPPHLIGEDSFGAAFQIIQALQTDNGMGIGL
jgi:hypothetical protein